jgi:hypothetical protein
MGHPRPSTPLPLFPTWAEPGPFFPAPRLSLSLSLFLHGPARAGPSLPTRAATHGLCQAGPTGQAFLPPFLAPPLFSPLAGPAVLPLTEGRPAAPWASLSRARAAPLVNTRAFFPLLEAPPHLGKAESQRTAEGTGSVASDPHAEALHPFFLPTSALSCLVQPPLLIPVFPVPWSSPDLSSNHCRR